MNKSLNEQPTAGQFAPKTAHICRQEGISHVLLDIEGTTCPVAFVAGTLFPYAQDQLADYLEQHRHEPSVQQLLAEVIQAWHGDPDPQAQALLNAHAQAGQDSQMLIKSVESYLQLLIQQDRKLTPLKDLQGMIWRQGYANGELKAPLFHDVPANLKRWSEQGLILAVFSSGSVAAQQLLYGHSNAGDLRGLFCHWFDTRIGTKKDAGSYRKIAAAMDCQPSQVLFISDIRAELEAAHAEGLRVLFSRRDGNPEVDAGVFESISNYDNLNIVQTPDHQA